MFNVHTSKTVNHGFFQAVKTKIDIFDIHTFRGQSKIHFERMFEKINKCIQVKDNVDFIYNF